MKTRQEIKQLSKLAMAEQRGSSILILFIYMLIAGAGSAISSFIGIIPVIGWLISIAITCFTLVLFVNVEGSFIKIYRKETTSVGEPFSALQVNFFRKLGGMWWMMLFYFLWSLLLVIPGIIKLISYSMTPFILAECPNVKAKDALKISMRMTKGHKGKLFVMALSFIGWFLLNGLTLGILGIFYVNPYFYTTCAGFYTELRDNAISTGAVSQAELDGAVVEKAKAKPEEKTEPESETEQRPEGIE